VGTEIDRLEIEVEAQATKANNALDKLVGKLERLAGSLGNIDGNALTGLSKGIDSLSNSMQGMKNVGTADFTRLAKNISQIGSVDTSGINKTANAINRISSSLGQSESVINGAAAIGELAKGISKLGNKSVITAIDNMPKLATALNSMMNTLSKAPTVSSNLINMTTALAGLANQGSKVGSTTRSMTSSLNGYSASAQRASQSSKGLASVFGSLYANFFWVKRGADKLWKSIETSMDYVETLNYFDAAFGQVAESAVSQWEDAGAESAEAYYKSFSDRAKQLTSKMTGFSVKDDGTLQATGQPSLGIDPEKLMNYQATFGQMASSMGVTAETSLKLSQALTEIGGDLASVKNLDFDKVWNDMASGLAGMSRTLDKYGVNIRNVNLQQKLYELGIQANITALNQNDKALLRAIILLDSTKYAWGDLATTINQPANQLRLIESNFQNLSRTIGNLFLPMVSKVLPYVNAMVIALQRLATWLGNLLGIDLSKVTSSVAESSFDFGSIADEAEAATEAVNKLQKGIRKFDELDVITTSSGSSSGSGGLDSGLLDDAFNKSFEEYQKAWDEAFANMENKAQDLADKIEEFFAPVKKIFQDLFAGDFFAAGQDTSKLVAGIFNWFADAIAAVDWYKIGHNIGEFLDGIDWIDVFKAVGRFMWEGINGAFELSAGLFDAAPIETAIITAVGLMKFTKLGKIVATKISKAIMGTSLIVAITKAWKSLGGFGGILTTDVATIMGAGTLTEIGMTVGAGIIGGIAAAFVGYNFGKEIGSWIFKDDKDLYDNFSWLGEGGFFDTIINTDIPTLADAWRRMVVDMSGMNGVVDTASDKVSKLVDLFNNSKIDITDTFGLASALKNMGPLVENWYQNKVAPWFTKERWESLGSNIEKALSEKWTAFSSWWQNVGGAEWWKSVQELFTEDKWNFPGIKNGFEKAWNNAVAMVKNIWSDFADWLNRKLNFSWDAVNITGKEIIPAGSIDLGKIPKFENGGYVPKSFSMFMAGENGNPELMFTKGGKTGVAPPEEITGIISAIVNSTQQEMEILRQQNELLRGILNKQFGISTDDIGKSARKYAHEYYRRTGEPAYTW
jgi:CII-binding regulator of phage lambda lysogenization HflD